MAGKRLSLPGWLLGLRHGLAARFTTLFMVMALIVAVTGMFGISKITLVGGTVQDMVRTRAAQEKMAVLMKVAVQEAWNRFEGVAGELIALKTGLLEAAQADKSGSAARASLSELRMNALIREETSSSVTKAARGLEAVDAGLKLVRGVETALGGIARFRRRLVRWWSPRTR
ncbi:MAG: hypothetical protein ACYC9Y_07940 [Candidatus Methylomirabilia bacterium]